MNMILMNFWKEEPETGMTRDDFGILSRLALSQKTLSFASTFQRTFVVFFSFLGFFWSVSSCQVNWNSSSTPGNRRKQTTETIANILWCLRSQIDPLVFIILLFTGPFTGSFIMHLHFEWFETKKTTPKDHTFASILIHIQTSHIEYTFDHLRTWIAQTLLTFSLLHHMPDNRVLPLGVWKIFEFASPFLRIMAAPLCQLWARSFGLFWTKTAFLLNSDKATSIKTGWKGKDVKH